MACFLESPTPDRYVPRTAEERKACAHVKIVFGGNIVSVRTLSEGGGRQAVCLVKVAGSFKARLEFICMGGLLVGIPPKQTGPM